MHTLLARVTRACNARFTCACGFHSDLRVRANNVGSLSASPLVARRFIGVAANPCAATSCKWRVLRTKVKTTNRRNCKVARVLRPRPTARNTVGSTAWGGNGLESAVS